jgi:hypothetical protein
VTTKPDYLEVKRQRLEKAALEYARMKVLGRYLDARGCDVSVSDTNRDDYTRAFGNALMITAVDLFAEIAATPLPPRKPTP